MRRRVAVAAAFLACGMAPAATPAAPRVHTIVVDGMAFKPATLSVLRGDHVVWHNRDIVPHTSTAAGAFDSGPIAAGKSWRWIADKAGEHAYVCTLHPTMQATLVVR